MDPKLLAKILIRIVAIYLIAEGVMQTPNIATMISYSSAQVSENTQMVIALSFTVLTPIFFGVFVWLISNKLSGWIVGVRDSGDLEAKLNSTQLQSIIFCSVGLLIIFITMPSLLAQIIQFNNENMISDKTFKMALVSNMVATVLKIFLGLLLVLGAKFWTRLLHNFREFGLREK